MKRTLMLCFALALFTALPSFAETVEGFLIDNMCSGSVAKKGVAAAKEHTKECALEDGCKGSGFSVVLPSGKLVKLDDKGNEMVIKALEESSKDTNIGIKVDGKVTGDSIAVTSLKLT